MDGLLHRSTALSHKMYYFLASLLLLGCCFNGFSDCLAQELLWSDEFDGDSLDSNVWEYNTGSGGWGNREIQDYRKENVRVRDGKLIISVQEEADGTVTSGRIYTKTHVSLQYGKIEASIKLPHMANGLWPAFWMLGANFSQVSWPASGTITVAQGGSGSARQQGLSLDQRVGSSVYWQADNGQTVADSNEISTLFDLTSAFLTYQLEWTPESITTFVEGIPIFSHDISSCQCEVLHQPFSFVLNVAVGGTYTQLFERSEISASLPAEMEVDYIRVYNNSYTQLARHYAPTYSNPYTQAPAFAPTGQGASPPTYYNSYTQAPAFAPTASPPTYYNPYPEAPALAPTGQKASPPTSPYPQAPALAPTEQVAAPTIFFQPTPFPVVWMPAPIETMPAPITPEPVFAVTISPTPPPTESPMWSLTEPPVVWTPAPIETTPAPITLAPIFAVTMSPTPPPTESPTWSPTDSPTLSPTDSPTARPSRTPTTSEPTTREPSFSATVSATDQPSVSPSGIPSATPTLAPLQRLTATGNTMALQNVEPLDSVHILTWQRVTQEHLTAEMSDILVGAELVYLSVTLTAQNPPFVVRQRSLVRNGGERTLQTTHEITFDTIVTIKSAKDDYDVNSFVDQAFESNEQKNSYLDELRNSDAVFANAGQLSMTQGPSTSQIQAPTAVEVKKPVVPFIVGFVAAAVALTLLGIFIIFARRKRRTKSTVTATRTSVTRSAIVRESHTYDADEDSLYDFNIEVSRGQSGDGASVYTNNSSVTMDYDDQVAFQKQSKYASAETGGPTGGVSQSYARRPSAQYYRYTVEAKPGLLGVVLESAADGTPSVYGIKNTSPLASDLRVGDLLVNVDGLDVSEMDATAVSRLIASKKNNKYRRLVFVRPREDDLDLDVEQDVD